jgi:molybdenum cofactor biosynthesis protein A
MPEEGVELTPHAGLLTTDEILRLATLFVKAGVDKIRLTGGEPTVRKDVEEVIGGLNGLRSIGLKTIAMTSNALALHRKLPKLHAAGLNALNISLDTLDEAKFERIARRPGLPLVLKSIHTALDLGISPLKINCVVMRGVNDDEVLDFVRWTKDVPLHIRFIEYMPFEGGGQWNDAKIMTMQQMIGMIRTKYPGFERKEKEDDLNLTSRTYAVPGWPGRVGFISSMSDHFCSSCNRVRLLADGSLKACLFGASEVSLRDALRSGHTDQQLQLLIHSAIQRKKASHDGMHQIDQNKSTNRPMILIGG